jgi:hypothetical protein
MWRECEGGEQGVEEVEPDDRLLSADVSPVEDDLARLAGDHRGESLLELVVVEAVSDDWRDVHPRFQHHRHLVPGFVQCSEPSPGHR